MKKTLVIILSIVLCVVLAGAAVAVGGEGKIFNKEDVLSEPVSETTETEKPVEAEALTAEDKALKAEIAKISDTKVDFRANKKQSLFGKNYNLEYKQINPLFNDKGTEKIDYVGKTEEGYDSEFIYNLKDGKLFLASLNLPKTEKQADSISIEEAEKLARKYASEYCDLNVYSLSYIKERTNEYVFVFTKFIDGYDTEDQVDVKVDFRGNLVYLRNNTGVFDGMEFTVDETKLIAELESKLNETEQNRKNYTIKKRRIVVFNGFPVMNYTVEIETQSYTKNIVFQIPIE